jgi:hypothetical protein
MLKRKADLSVNVIIVAALALAVFVVLATLFTNKSKDFSSGINSCASKQGKCTGTENQKECGQGQATIPNTNCEKEKKGICCVQVLT